MNTLHRLASSHADRRGYTDSNERQAFVVAFVHGWNERHDMEPAKINTEWPNAYGAGYWEGAHRKEKYLCQ